jgi:hypothetical protein
MYVLHLAPESALLCPADDDGLISFEEFLVSYAKPKPIGKNMLIMAINTAAIYLILQAPFLDVMLKVRLRQAKILLLM